MTTLAVAGGQVELQPAVAEDLPAVVALLADDPIGSTREAAPDDGEAALAPYRRAFALLDAARRSRRCVCGLTTGAGEGAGR